MIAAVVSDVSISVVVTFISRRRFEDTVMTDEPSAVSMAKSTTHGSISGSQCERERLL